MSLEYITQTCMKIRDAYVFADNFALNMDKFEMNGITRENMSQYPLEQFAFDVQDERREYMMEHWRTSLLVGTMLYLICHPQKMIPSQKYYAGKFSPFCPLTKKHNRAQKNEA